MTGVGGAPEARETTCAVHGVALRPVQLTRGDGQPMGAPLMLCDVCEREADDDLDDFLGRIRSGELFEDS